MRIYTDVNITRRNRAKDENDPCIIVSYSDGTIWKENKRSKKERWRFIQLLNTATKEVVATVEQYDTPKVVTVTTFNSCKPEYKISVNGKAIRENKNSNSRTREVLDVTCCETLEMQSTNQFWWPTSGAVIFDFVYLDKPFNGADMVIETHEENCELVCE